MKLTYCKATSDDSERIYQLCKQLIEAYEDIDRIDYDSVLKWVRKKTGRCIDEYTAIYADGRKAGYYRFYKNGDGVYEIDDLYVFDEFQNQGIGSEVIRRCCESVNEPVILYVFIKNKRAVSLYERLGFEVAETVGNSRYIMKRRGEKQMELWDLYNKDRELIGKTHVRGEAIPDGCFHLVVHVWMRNKQGKYLISQRSENRPTFPLMWECVGGSVTAGEDSLAGALRETIEEVGIALDPTSGRMVFSRVRDYVGGKRFGDIMDVWLFDFDGDADLDAATTDEVADVRWMSCDEIRTLFEEGKLVHTLGYFFTEVERK